MRTEIARQFGIYQPEVVLGAAHRAGLGGSISMALVDGESGGTWVDGKHYEGGLPIYGHDPGGALSTRDGPVTVCGVTYPQHSDIPVTAANFLVFWTMVMAGKTSNGVNAGQTTYAKQLTDGRSGGLFRLMFEENLLPWVTADELFFEFRRVKGWLDDGHTLVEAGTLYNEGNLTHGVTQYGRDFEARVEVWRSRFHR